MTKEEQPLIPHSFIPVHQRFQPDFIELFGRSEQQAITAMNAEDDDIPNQRPCQEITLPAMGVNRAHIPVSILDPFAADRTVQLYCTVKASASVSPLRRGIHVSRIGDLLARMSSKIYPSLQEYCAELCLRLGEVQDSGTATASVSGILSYLEEVRGVKHKNSVEHLEMFAEANSQAGVANVSAGIGFNHITACPCVQQTYKHALGDPHQALAHSLNEAQIPLITHSQRCTSRIKIIDAPTAVPIQALLETVDRVVVRCQNTLPREFELMTVYRAHKEPQFLEDALRQMLQAIYHLLRTDFPESRIHIQASSMESIHDFDIQGEISYTMNELRALWV